MLQEEQLAMELELDGIRDEKMRQQIIVLYLWCILQAQRDRLVREEQMLQEERLAMELEKRKLDGIRDEKMRQQIRETR